MPSPQTASPRQRGCYAIDGRVRYARPAYAWVGSDGHLGPSQGKMHATSCRVSTGRGHMTEVLPQLPCCALCRIVQHPLPKEPQLYPAIATPFAQLQAVALAFAGSGCMNRQRHPMTRLGQRAVVTPPSPSQRCRVAPGTVPKWAQGIYPYVAGTRPRVWAYFHARLACTMAAFNVLVQWHGLRPNTYGVVPLSRAEVSFQRRAPLLIKPYTP